MPHDFLKFFMMRLDPRPGGCPQEPSPPGSMPAGVSAWPGSPLAASWWRFQKSR